MTQRTPERSRARAGRRGSVAVQVAFGLPVLMIGILGIMETGRILWARSTLQFAAEETARYAMINTSWSAATLTSVLHGRISGLNPAIVQVQITNQTVAGVAFVAIRASMPQRAVSFLRIDAITISGYARVPAGV